MGGCRVSCRRPPSATMPGIDKLPIEETLEDSPQVRRGRRREAREGAGRADPRPGAAAAAGARFGSGGRRRPVSPPVAGRAPSRRGPAASPRPAWACTAGPRGTRGVWDVGGRRPNLRRLRSWARRSRTFRGSLVFDERCVFIACKVINASPGISSLKVSSEEGQKEENKTKKQP